MSFLCCLCCESGFTDLNTRKSRVQKTWSRAKPVVQSHLSWLYCSCIYRNRNHLFLRAFSSTLHTLFSSIGQKPTVGNCWNSLPRHWGRGAVLRGIMGNTVRPLAVSAQSKSVVSFKFLYCYCCRHCHAFFTTLHQPFHWAAAVLL